MLLVFHSLTGKTINIDESDTEVAKITEPYKGLAHTPFKILKPLLIRQLGLIEEQKINLLYGEIKCGDEHTPKELNLAGGEIIHIRLPNSAPSLSPLTSTTAVQPNTSPVSSSTTITTVSDRPVKDQTEHGTSAHLSPGRHSPDARINELNPLYSLKPGINPAVFKNILIDDYSKELLDKANEGQRYAVVGFLDDDKMHLRFRPGFDSDITEEEKKAARARFGEIVVAKKGGAGIVHEETIKYVIAREPELNFKQTIGLSLIKKGKKYIWLNRSAQNYSIFPRDSLALACVAFTKEQTLTPIRNNYNEAYHLARSMPALYFSSVIKAATCILTDNKIAESFFLDPRANFDSEVEWDIIRYEKKLESIQKKLMRTIVLASNLSSDLKHTPRGAPRSGYEKDLIRALNAAKEYKIPLNLEYNEFDSSVSALQVAASKGYLAVCQALVEGGAVVTSNLLANAAASGQWEVVKFFFGKLNPDERKAEEDALINCVRNNLKSLADEKNTLSVTQLEDMHSFLQKLKINFDWNEPDLTLKTPLSHVIASRRIDLFEFFYEKEKNVQVKKQALLNFLQTVIWGNREDYFEELLTKFSVPAEDKFILLMMAIDLDSSIHFLRLLMPPIETATEANLKFLTVEKDLLHIIIDNGKLEFLKEILAMEWAVKTRLNNPINLYLSSALRSGLTPLEYALSRKNWNSIKLLYRYNDDSFKNFRILIFIKDCIMNPSDAISPEHFPWIKQIIEEAPNTLLLSPEFKSFRDFINQKDYRPTYQPIINALLEKGILSDESKVSFKAQIENPVQFNLLSSSASSSLKTTDQSPSPTPTKPPNPS